MRFFFAVLLLHARHGKEGLNSLITAYVLFCVLICSNARLAYVSMNGKRHAHLSFFLSFFLFLSLASSGKSRSRSQLSSHLPLRENSNSSLLFSLFSAILFSFFSSDSRVCLSVVSSVLFSCLFLSFLVFPISCALCVCVCHVCVCVRARACERERERERERFLFFVFKIWGKGRV